MWQYNNTNELYHFGIKGMRWGVRRYQKNDGTLTPAGKKRYSDDTNNKKNIFQRHKDKLIEKYKERGYSQENAEAAANRRIKTELIVGAAATVAVSVIATKAAVRLGQEYADKTIKSGKVVQNIGAAKDATFENSPFYAAINRHDKKAYGSMYPGEKQSMTIQSGKNYEGIYNNQLKVTKDIKRASVNNSRKIFYNMMDNDPDFKNKVLDTLEETRYGQMGSAVSNYRATGRKSKKLYDRFNQALATPEMQKSGLHKKFYSELKKNGYDAILDINDTRYSGYKNIAKSPTIIFGNDKIKKISGKRIDESDIKSNALKYMAGYNAKALAKKAATYGGAFAIAKRVSNQRKIDKYLDEHPNSKLSDKEILEVVNASY